MTSSFQIAHVIPYIGSSKGGPVHSLAHQLASQVQEHHISILTTPISTDDPDHPFHPDVQIHKRVTKSCLGLRYSPGLISLFQQHTSHNQIIHSHLLWTHANCCAAKFAHEKKLPHIISPCGTLNQQALSYRSYKKKPIAWAFQNKALHQATCLHAKSELELQSIRDYGLSNPVALIPNTSEILDHTKIYSSNQFLQKYQLPTGKKILLYLGRIHPVKGTKRLLEAWSKIFRNHPDWILVIAGSNENNHQKELEEYINKQNIGQSIYFLGMLKGIDKWAALNSAQLFILPSDFENFGSSALEAAQMKLPIIATKGTPWSLLESQNAGWWVDPSQHALSEAMHVAMSLPQQTLEEKGHKAYILTQDTRPEKTSKKWNELYRWLYDKNSKPHFVT